MKFLRKRYFESKVSTPVYSMPRPPDLIIVACETWGFKKLCRTRRLMYQNTLYTHELKFISLIWKITLTYFNNAIETFFDETAVSGDVRIYFENELFTINNL